MTTGDPAAPSPVVRRDDAAPDVVAETPADALPLDLRAEIAELDDLAYWLDARFRIPIVGWRFGVDALLGLVPLAGDAAALMPSAYLVWRGHRLGVRSGTLGGMVGNTALDFAVGSIPILGSIFDVAFKANLRNIELLKADLAARLAEAEAAGAIPAEEPGAPR